MRLNRSPSTRATRISSTPAPGTCPEDQRRRQDLAQHQQGVIDDLTSSIISDPLKPGIVYASACSGIYKSENGGELFHKIQGILADGATDTRAHARPEASRNRSCWALPKGSTALATPVTNGNCSRTTSSSTTSTSIPSTLEHLLLAITPRRTGQQRRRRHLRSVQPGLLRAQG